MNKEKGRPEGRPSTECSLDLESQREQIGIKNLQAKYLPAARMSTAARAKAKEPEAAVAIPEPRRKLKLRKPDDWFPNDRGAFGVDHCCAFPRGGAWVVQIMRPELIGCFTRKRNKVGHSHAAFKFCEQFAFTNKTKWQVTRMILEALATMPDYRDQVVVGGGEP